MAKVTSKESFPFQVDLCWRRPRMTRSGSRRKLQRQLKMQEESWEKSACDHYCHLVMHCDVISEIVQNSSCHQRDGNEAKAFIVRSFEDMETNLTSRSSHIMNTYFHIRAPPFSALCHLQFFRFVFHFSSHLILSLHSTWNIVCPRMRFWRF